MNEAAPNPYPDDDPVVVRRQRIDTAAGLGRRVGYALFGIAIAVFLIGFFSRFSTWVANTISVCLVIGSILLIPSIVLGYAVKAADRHDRGLPSGH